MGTLGDCNPEKNEVSHFMLCWIGVQSFFSIILNNFQKVGLCLLVDILFVGIDSLWRIWRPVLQFGYGKQGREVISQLTILPKRRRG